MVTLGECYRRTRAGLARIGVGNPSNEAMLLCAHILGISDRASLLVHGDEPAPPESAQALECAVGMRASTPLQYILGRWEFDSMSLHVRPGVLVPRQDTLALVGLASQRIHEGARILDLCAGSGAVGLALVRRTPGAQCVCVELSDDALGVLGENCAEFGCGRTQAVRADVLCAPPGGLGRFDLICSNPPYIPSRDVDSLEGDVRREPALALDGGEDGLDFYRAILSGWLGLLAPGGSVAFEFGIGQTHDVRALMEQAKLSNIEICEDYGHIERAIIGTLPD